MYFCCCFNNNNNNNNNNYYYYNNYNNYNNNNNNNNNNNYNNNNNIIIIIILNDDLYSALAWPKPKAKAFYIRIQLLTVRLGCKNVDGSNTHQQIDSADAAPQIAIIFSKLSSSLRLDVGSHYPLERCKKLLLKPRSR